MQSYTCHESSKCHQSARCAVTSSIIIAVLRSIYEHIMANSQCKECNAKSAIQSASWPHSSPVIAQQRMSIQVWQVEQHSQPEQLVDYIYAYSPQQAFIQVWCMRGCIRPMQRFEVGSYLLLLQHLLNAINVQTEESIQYTWPLKVMG